jgi:hypothetical protein
MRALRCLAISLARFAVTLGLGACAVLLMVAAVRLFQPVADIRPTTAARIQPGMTLEQAEQIIGAPCGWYDGLGGMYFDKGSPPAKGDFPSWHGQKGAIVIGYATGSTAAKFYYGKPLNWSFPRFVAERLTRRDQTSGGILPQERLTGFLVVTFPVIFIVSRRLLRPSLSNTLANHGAVGIAVGIVIGGLAFLSSEFGSIFMLAASIGASLMGMGIGLSRLQWPGASPAFVSTSPQHA